MCETIEEKKKEEKYTNGQSFSSITDSLDWTSHQSDGDDDDDGEDFFCSLT